MIKYEDALEKAKSLKPNIDHCAEYDNAWMFSSEDDAFTIGGDSPVVVMKDSGETLTQIGYYSNGNWKKEELKVWKLS